MCNKELGDIYIASCVETGGIYHYKLRSGKLQLADVTPMDRPMYMVIENRKMYVVLRAPFPDSKDSGVVVYDIDKDGRLTHPSPIQSTHGTVACHILVDEDEVYCANYVSGSVVKLPDTLVCHSGSGPNPSRQDGPHAHFVGLTPDKKYVCAADLGLDTVFLYNRDMILHAQAKVPDGHGVRHLAFSEDGKWLFAVNELQSTVSVFSYADGTLTHRDVCSTLPEGFTGESTAAAVRVHNGSIYVSNRGHDSVARLDFESGRLALGSAVPCGGKNPRDIFFAGDYLLCANQDSDTVTVLNSHNGFAAADCIQVEKPVCICAGKVPELEVSDFDGPGYQPLVDYNGWRMAIANYMPKLEIQNLVRAERHMQTDEVFVLLEGSAGLLMGEDREKVHLEPGKLYNVKRGVWHSLFMTQGGKVLIVENTDTGAHNTEFRYFQN